MMMIPFNFKISNVQPQTRMTTSEMMVYEHFVADVFNFSFK